MWGKSYPHISHGRRGLLRQRREISYSVYLDFPGEMCYDCPNNRQFATILSLNKTRERRWARCALFCCMRAKKLARAGILAALYAALCHLQNLIFPGSGNLALQFRGAEALCVFAFFTPAAVPGLSLGCLLYNLTAGAGLPLDLIFGTAATALAALGMRRFRRHPRRALLLPALTNGVLVGWELTVWVGGAFRHNALAVAAGETAVLLLLGYPLLRLLEKYRDRIWENAGEK